MQNFIGYMFFSFIEGFAVFALMFYLFRIDLAKYLTPITLLNIFINCVSFFVREESSLSTLSPIVNLLICILFITLFAGTPIIWSIIIALTGFMAFGLIQLSIVFFSALTVDQVQDATWKIYMVQCVSGVVGTAIAFVIYRLGYGFSFEFEKLRFRWERILIISLVIVFFVVIVVTLAIRSLFGLLLVVAIGFALLLLYSRWKDVDR
ncbi:hypothetical protein [Cohnella panacarvi]|uniref:hypothetical protein n=1 Tax=Cohnella panacarvi TaxID=400776 RepID=UPI00047D741E|nr:hypothetical protein [Cohnella panacarvi]